MFENVAPGRYNDFEKTGFVTQRYGARSDTSPGTPLVLEAGNELKDVAIQMTPQAVIAGRVTDQDGDPVANIGVSVFRYGTTMDDVLSHRAAVRQPAAGAVRSVPAVPVAHPPTIKGTSASAIFLRVAIT